MAFRNTRSSSVHWMAAAVLVALLSSTYAEFDKMECTHVDYLCFFHLDLCEASCKEKASAEGSENFRAGCDGPGPDRRHQCCCTTLPPGPPPPFWPPPPGPAPPPGPPPPGPAPPPGPPPGPAPPPGPPPPGPPSY